MQSEQQDSEPHFAVHEAEENTRAHWKDKCYSKNGIVTFILDSKRKIGDADSGQQLRCEDVLPEPGGNKPTAADNSSSVCDSFVYRVCRF